jgi:DNA-binding transcriptional ArsR family regulator
MEPNEDVLKEILELVLYQPVSATELKDRYRSKLTEDTISRHLKTLFDQGHLERSWCGTQHLGHYLYRRIDPGQERDATWERATAAKRLPEPL